MPRWKKYVLLVSNDTILILISVWGAYTISLGDVFAPSSSQLLRIMIVPLLAIPIFQSLGFYKSVIRYLGENAIWAIFQGMVLLSSFWFGLVFLAQIGGRIDDLPWSVPVVFLLLGFLAISGSRFAARWLLLMPTKPKFKGVQVIIYGAGEAGRQLVSLLRGGHKYFPVGFMDDDINLQGKYIEGLKVYAPADLSLLVKRFKIDSVIICFKDPSSQGHRDIAKLLEHHKIKGRILPALSDIVEGADLIGMIREIDVSDLLGRKAVAPDPILMQRCVSAKAVLITGAGGSIGSELCKQISSINPSKVILLDSNEAALYQIDRRIKKLSNAEVTSCLGSVQDRTLLHDLLSKHKVQTVYHAAAHKHVPLLEINCIEGVKNNVFGTLSVLDAAFNSQVKNFVLISSDKAVHPKSVMGASKALAEKIVCEYAERAAEFKLDKKFCSVRFGNVLGSSGSVVPLFEEQIKSGGPVTVTNESATRYFMSLHEAAELVIQAGSMALGGEIFQLDMGQPVNIMDLATNMINLSGYSVRDSANSHGDIEIEIIGLRPGEKLHEELLVSGTKTEGTIHPLITKHLQIANQNRGLNKSLDLLKETLDARDEVKTREILLSLSD